MRQQATLNSLSSPGASQAARIHFSLSTGSFVQRRFRMISLVPELGGSSMPVRRGNRNFTKPEAIGPNGIFGLFV